MYAIALVIVVVVFATVVFANFLYLTLARIPSAPTFLIVDTSW